MRKRLSSTWFQLGCLCLYQLAFFVFFLVAMVWRIVLDPRYRRGMRQRLGFVPRSRGDRPVVWIHGVSVGEVKAAGSLIKQLQEQYPELELVISSTTPTGFNLAQQLHLNLQVILYPLDLLPCPAIALGRINPACVLLMELEVWPAFLHTAARRGAHIVVINGRISEQSFKGYRLARHFLPQLNYIERYCMQDDVYRRRLLDLDVAAECTRVTGNLKYDNVILKEPSAEVRRLRTWLQGDAGMVLVCGSTHGEEDVWLVGAAREVQKNLGQSIRVVVAPRHPERVPSVRESFAKHGYANVLWSEGGPDHGALPEDAVLIVDTIGQLEALYGAADVAFIGGSLVPRGGQNMVEAAAQGIAVLFGPNVSNFRKDVQMLLQAEAVCQISGLAELRPQLESLFGDAELRARLGERAVALIQRNQGSTNRTMEMLREILAQVQA